MREDETLSQKNAPRQSEERSTEPLSVRNLPGFNTYMNR